MRNMAFGKWILVLALVSMAFSDKQPGRNGKPVHKIPPKGQSQKTKPQQNKKPNQGSDNSGGNYFLHLNDNLTQTLVTRLSAGPECGDFYLGDGEEGILYSGTDTSPLNCISTIQGPDGTTISIMCPHFDLSTRGCRKESLIVSDVSAGTEETFCGRDGPFLTTTGPYLELQHSRVKLRRKQCTGGFMCSISVGKVPSVIGQCGEYTLGENQFSIIFSNNDGGKTRCRYKLQVRLEIAAAVCVIK
ncbi:hypothetical protein SK128_005154 [Halocaridina rubra]|uniref:CUB domain-containing protein n=1 Tax=Halocaridina rubra TaxID=373956 RepID=A0AAN9A467_HALRR